MRLLVVEDHEDLAANIGDFLASHGHTVDFALDGLTGLHLALTKTSGPKRHPAPRDPRPDQGKQDQRRHVEQDDGETHVGRPKG